MTTSFADLIASRALVVNDGYRTKKSELGDSGIPILRVAEIGDGFLDPTSRDRIREEFRSVIGPKLSQPGDVLLTTKGTVGRRAIVPESGAGFAYSPQVCFFRVLDDSIDPRWLYYWLGGHEFWDQAVGVSAQTDMAPYISLRDLRAISIELPPIDEQHAIATALGAFDDKIESDQRASALVEDLLAAAFQQVLVTESVDYVSLGDLAVITKGVSYKSADLSESRTSLVTLKSFDRNGGYKAEGLKPYIGPYKPAQVIRPGEVVVAQTDLTQGAEVVGRAVRVPSDSSADTLVASLDLVILRPAEALTSEYLLAILTDEAFRQHCRNRTNGTTVLHLAGDAIPTYGAPVVSSEAQAAYSAIARPLIARRDALEQEIATLRRTRDALLPDLLFGRIHVSEEVAA